MSKINDAIARITQECEGKDYLIPFEEYLTSICNSDEIANKILNPKKTLEGCFSEMKKVAEKRMVRKGNVGNAMIPPEEGFQIISDYYGIELKEKKSASVLDVLDLL
ncbi:MAG: hypothetical protein ACI4LC_06005 [Emergencia sp.]